VAVHSSNTTYAVWQDSRNGNVDIYFSGLANAAVASAANVKISDDPRPVRHVAMPKALVVASRGYGLARERSSALVDSQLNGLTDHVTSLNLLSCRTCGETRIRGNARG
jgi:hypothetical protein